MAATTLAGAFAQGLDASKPAASSALEGYCYFSSDLNGGTLFQCKSSAWVQLTTGVSAVKANGLTGATAASRYAGATTSSSPTSGTFAVGDFVIAQNGAIWVCTVAGTPGTWASASGGGVTSLTGTANQVTASASTGAVTLSTPQSIATTSTPTFGALTIGGLTGATAASRYVGAVASGAPASGTFAVGDFTVDQTGKLWVCTGAGSPGTWTQVGGSSGATTLITDTTVSGSVAANFDFTSISGSYKHLRIVGQVRGDTSANSIVLQATLNNDTTAAHYEWENLEWYSAGTQNGQESGSAAFMNLGHATAATSIANWPGTFTIDIPNYASTVFYKGVMSDYSYATGGGTAGMLRGIAHGFWLSTAAVTRVTLTPGAGNFIIGSRVSLYGIS